MFCSCFFLVIVQFFVKVVQTAVAHACDLAVHPVTEQKSKGEDGSHAVPGAKKNLLHAASTDRRQNRFLSLKKHAV